MKFRKQIESLENSERLEYFKNQGIKASDKYYINQDAREEVHKKIK